MNLDEFEKSSELDKTNTKYYTIDISGIITLIHSVNKFMGLHPEFFNTNISKKMVYFNDSLINVYLEPVIFRDIIHNVKGFITTSYDTEFKMLINIRSSKTKNCYLKQIQEYIDKQSMHGNLVQLYYNKILSDTIIKHCYYDQCIDQWANDVKTLQDEFFLPEKDYLLSIMHNKINNNNIGSGTNSWNNMLLFGAPGTGKSSFVYRISMILKKSIISVDLSLFLNKKKDLYALFHNQDFNLPNSKSKDKEPALKNCIIILEEFDTAIEKLLQIEEIFKYKDILKKNYLETKNRDIKKKALAFADNRNDSDISDDAAPPMDSDDYESFMERMMLQDGFDTKNNKVLDRAREEILEQRDQGNELNSINLELDNIIKSMDIDNKSEIVRLADLLELFQGPVPISRQIIATTNHFNKIKSSLPALFRPGRLTDIEFKYLDWATLNKLTVYYLKDKMTLPEFPITIATSHIVEMAIKYKLTSKSFSEFEHELFTACSK